MDRNEEFRRRLDKRLNASTKIGKQGFNPTPYIDIVMERIYFEDVEESEDIEALMDEILTDPDLDFIFGHSSLFNPAQKAKTAEGVLQRIVAYDDFDPQPHALTLIDLFQTPEFDQHIEVDEEGVEEYDFNPYYAQYDFTKEQKELIEEAFFRHKTKLLEAKIEQKEQAIAKKQRIWGAFVLIVFVFLPSFFIPNLLQRIGWLPQDAGWFLKITIVIISCIVLSKILIKGTWAETARELRNRNNG